MRIIDFDPVDEKRNYEYLGVRCTMYMQCVPKMVGLSIRYVNETRYPASTMSKVLLSLRLRSVENT